MNETGGQSDDLDLLVRQAIQLVHEQVNLPVGGLRGFLRQVGWFNQFDQCPIDGFTV